MFDISVWTGHESDQPFISNNNLFSFKTIHHSVRQAGRQSVAFMDFDISQLVDVEIIINGKFIEGKQIVRPKKQICYRLNVDSNEKSNKTKINESTIKNLLPITLIP